MMDDTQEDECSHEGACADCGQCLDCSDAAYDATYARIERLEAALRQIENMTVDYVTTDKVAGQIARVASAALEEK